MNNRSLTEKKTDMVLSPMRSEQTRPATTVRVSPEASDASPLSQPTAFSSEIEAESSISLLNGAEVRDQKSLDDG